MSFIISARVCKMHFAKSDFKLCLTTERGLMNFGLKLSEDAVPQLFLPDTCTDSMSEITSQIPKYETKEIESLFENQNLAGREKKMNDRYMAGLDLLESNIQRLSIKERRRPINNTTPPPVRNCAIDPDFARVKKHGREMKKMMVKKAKNVTFRKNLIEEVFSVKIQQIPTTTFPQCQ